MGSILIVGVLYVATVFVTAGTFSPSRLQQLGETAIVEVARVYLGVGGAVAILLAGFLATLSSANATLLGGSRVLHALSRDDVVPPHAGRISQRYGTPHFALSFVGGLAICLVVVGRLDTLAEVASFLHLVMYGLMCVAQLRLSRATPGWYDPSFQCPGTPYVPIVGVLASVGLIAFMQSLSQAVGIVIIVFSGLWYQAYTDGVTVTPEVNDA
ncbi:putative fructoselysine transporter [Halolamina pelagica]|uniref:Putative fructoselysine transporter n=1 Tax=Halolamina pelagica TaxID=699431 RepID=A0A0N8HZH1_9EURY|nr:putative fructoselysine transporter [Halolamina pelagica]